LGSAAYCDFFSGSLVASDDDEPLGGVLAPEELLLLGALLGAEVAPPEAAPELDLEGSVALGELDEAPPEGEVAEDELEPELEGGVVVALPLVLPLLPVVLPVPASWPHAARPKAKATVAAMIESFMNSSMVGNTKEAAKNGPGPNSLKKGTWGPGPWNFLLAAGGGGGALGRGVLRPARAARGTGCAAAGARRARAGGR